MARETRCSTTWETAIARHHVESAFVRKIPFIRIASPSCVSKPGGSIRLRTKCREYQAVNSLWVVGGQLLRDGTTV